MDMFGFSAEDFNELKNKFNIFLDLYKEQTETLKEIEKTNKEVLKWLKK